MYRTVTLLYAFIGYTSSAPQSSLEPVEVIADVKPTTYDMPFSVYDVPSSLPIQQPAVINDDSLDSNLEDFPFEITTESLVDLAKYPEIVTDNYDAITEPPESDYGVSMKDPKFYSKLGYFLRPQVMAGALNNNADPITYINIKHDVKEEMIDFKINTTKHDNSSEGFQTKDNESNKAVNTSVAIIQSSFKNKTASVENEPSSVENKSSSVGNNPSAINKKPIGNPNKPNSDDSVKNSVEIDENSVEIKTDSVQFKSNKIGFQPKYTSMRRKGNTARQISKSPQRKFRSKCRCEKIWNCPRLQITVPRCPNEYFMCCF